MNFRVYIYIYIYKENKEDAIEQSEKVNSYSPWIALILFLMLVSSLSFILPAILIKCRLVYLQLSQIS